MIFTATKKEPTERMGPAREYIDGPSAAYFVCFRDHVFTPDEQVILRELNGEHGDYIDRALCPKDRTTLATMSEEYAKSHYNLTPMKGTATTSQKWGHHVHKCYLRKGWHPFRPYGCYGCPGRFSNAMKELIEAIYKEAKI